MRALTRRTVLLAAACAVLGALAGLLPAGAGAVTLPPGFSDRPVFEEIYTPTAVRFAPAPGNEVFVAEKSGRIWSYSGLSDPSPTLVADLREQVHNYWDRGLLGLAVDPQFAINRRLYVLYTRNALPDGTAPAWPSNDPDSTDDTCPDPPGAERDGCVVTGRLSRLELDPLTRTAGSEQVLVDDWCQQFASHSIGDLAFGPDGALYASGGEGADHRGPDYGQWGGSPDGHPAVPRNPCGDPPGRGKAATPPTAEGGALRSQDLRTDADPAGLSGSIIRIDPQTGAALPDNPLAGEADPKKRRVIAHGMRNPFRFAFRPGTPELWVGDVGWTDWEELDRVPHAGADGTVENFGWPCREGPAAHAGYRSLDLALCEGLDGAGPGAATEPSVSVRHDQHMAEGDGCSIADGSSLSGLAFEHGSDYPEPFRGALFVADYSRRCIVAIPAGAGGAPDVSRATAFQSESHYPVDLQVGPGGDLFYADLVGGAIRRIEYFPGNQPPLARADASPTYGAVPLAVTFDATSSTDPENGALSYAWDLDGDGGFDDSTAARPTHTYTTAGSVRVRVRVSDPAGATAIATVRIDPGNTPPRAFIDAPGADLRWAVGDELTLAGRGSEGQGDDEGEVPPERLGWEVILNHCEEGGGCHAHTVESFPGSGRQLSAPDHAYPAHLELRLTATDATGLTATESRRLDPRTSKLTLDSSPTRAFRLTLGGATGLPPVARTLIVGSQTTVAAELPPPESPWAFTGWSDGGARVHGVTAPGTSSVLTALYRDKAPPRLSGLALRPTTFRVLRRGSGGARLVFGLSEPGSVILRVDRLTSGRMVGGRCRPLSAANRARPRCTLATRLAGHETRAARTGDNSLLFSGRWGGRALAPGRYRLLVTARDGVGRSSPTAGLRFSISG